MTMQNEIELSLEQILAKLKAQGKQITPESLARIEENLRLAEARRQLRRDAKQPPDPVKEQAFLAHQAIRSFAQGGIVDRELKSHVEKAAYSGLPLKFVMFIGGGKKQYGDSWDKRLRDKTLRLLQEAKSNHQAGVKLHLILADEHVVRNGYVDESGEILTSARMYMNAFAQDLQNKQQEGIHIDAIHLSDLYKSHGLQPMTEERARQDRNAETIFWRHRQSLESNARRHSRTGIERQVDAIRYVAMRMQEREILARSFPNAILLAPGVNTGAQDIILPESHTAIFFGGKSPWFLGGGGITNA